MSVEKNKEIVRVYTEECWGRGELTRVPEFVAADADAGHGAPGRGPESYQREIVEIRRGISEYRTEVQDLFGEGNRVAIRWRTTGKHTGPLMGFPPSGRAIDVTGVDIFELEGGKIIRHFGESVVPTLMAQIGAFPGQR